MSTIRGSKAVHIGGSDFSLIAPMISYNVRTYNKGAASVEHTSMQYNGTSKCGLPIKSGHLVLIPAAFFVH